jgi:hypothetical protein
MIVLVGVPSEGPLRLVADAAERLGLPSVTVNQRHVDSVGLSLQVDDGEVRGWLEVDGDGYPLEAVTGVYSRMTDARTLPEVALHPQRDVQRGAERFADLVDLWLETTPARVANRSSAMASNGSKPYQAALIRRHGLHTPPTLVTTDRAEVSRFAATHGPLVYKSISGVRSIVTTLAGADDARLDDLRWCPGQFQALVPGFDVRVHVVGDDVFATRVTSSAVDYRYAVDQTGEAADLQPFDLPDDLAAQCRALTAALGLLVSGIDLRLSSSASPVCFEVNPSPGFSYYELSTGQPIAEAIARLLGPQSASTSRSRARRPVRARPRA